jgi:hypothetical protein
LAIRAQPQPITNFAEDPNYHFALRVPKKNPDLGRIVVSIMGEYALTDYVWSLTFVLLLHADPKTGSAIYHSVSGAESRRAAVTGAAKARLSAKDYLLFQAVERALTSQRKRRNAFAHGLWGVSKHVDDALLLADPEIFVNQRVSELLAQKRNRRKKGVVMLSEIETSRIMVYSRAALLETYREAVAARDTVIALVNALYETNGARINVPARRRLLRRPRVGPALRRLTQQNNPQGQLSPRPKSQKKKQ